jgi:phosphoadenosine phosphosulfate reductase
MPIPQSESSIQTTTTPWTPALLKEVSARFEGSPPEAVLQWGFENFGPQIVLATGFGPEGIVLMHLVSRMRPQTVVFYLDTDLLFSNTYELRDELEKKLGINFVRVHSGLSLDKQADRHGDALWDKDPDTCCLMRKVIPQREFLKNYQAWITGIRRDQTAFRANTGLMEWDFANKMVKLNPLAAWTSEQSWDYIRKNDLPYNMLHDFGYPSIGCWTCTKAVNEGDDPRSGRWADKIKTECGIHLSSVAQIPSAQSSPKLPDSSTPKAS